ncbi:MAG: alanine racemase [Candidatus Cloacimonadota bacterium]|nr:alanine racemase [Candidatus Cloacimonadota bacterium]
MISKITSPTLLLDKKKCLENIKNMFEKAKRNNLTFRPHFKTPQSAIIGNWFREMGVNKITVSSVKMAYYFASNGWDDITIAFPFNILEVNDLNNLLQHTKINVLADDILTIRYLHNHLHKPAGVFIKIDTGYKRSGVNVENIEYIKKLVRELNHNSLLKFKGFLTHSGQMYDVSSKAEILKIHNETIEKLLAIKNKFTNSDDLILSIGDTPSCSIADSFPGIDEIRPGNFVFYDIMQEQIGSCEFSQIAVTLACPVVSKNADRNEIVVYGGGSHLSKEYIRRSSDNEKVFGYIVKFDANSWSEPIPDSYVCRLSQEHGIVKISDTEFQNIQIGDVIGILPVHSCLTANLMKKYLSLDGEVIPMMA